MKLGYFEGYSMLFNSKPIQMILQIVTKTNLTTVIVEENHTATWL